MEVSKKLFLDRAGLEEHGPITIVAFGDSITHGALGGGEINYETVYWNRLKKKLNAVRAYMPVNVINAGIGGNTASGSVARMDKQVLAHNPDLVIICFGLNDVNRPLEDYITALSAMFTKCKDAGVDTIFMTPNMLNTYVAEGTAQQHLAYAAKTAAFQNEGRMDLFVEEAKTLAKGMGITVCDCYSKWKELAKTQDTTLLLDNRINHPSADMHELFAEELFKIIFAEMPTVLETYTSTMFEE